MSFYSKHIFPLLLDMMLGAPEIGEVRRVALAPARGKTLEIGFGTALNLPFYPPAVTGLTVIDSENMLHDLVDRRITACSIPVTRMQLDAQGRLPFDDATFDSVVTTFTLCTIPNVAAALAEVHRVLKPDGQFIFLEHGRSDSADVAKWQDRLNPFQKFFGVGCNLNRKIDRIIQEAGFKLIELERFLLPKAPRFVGEMYRGVAQTVQFAP